MAESRTRIWIDALGAIAALVLAVVCWRLGTTTSSFGPMLPDTPSFESTHYSGLWISGAALALLLAGLMTIDIVHRLRGGGSFPDRGTGGGYDGVHE